MGQQSNYVERHEGYVRNSWSSTELVDTFIEHVTRIRDLDRIIDELFQNTFAQHIMETTAYSFMRLMNELTVNSLLNSLSRITEPAMTSGKENLTVERIVDEMVWTEGRDIKAQRIKERCDCFHELLKEGRNKRLAHNDLGTSLTNRGFPLPEGLHKEAIEELEFLISIACEQNGRFGKSVILLEKGDVIDFRKALGDSLLYRRALEDSRLPESMKKAMLLWRLDLSNKMQGSA